MPVDGTTVKFERYDFGKGVSFSSCSETVPEAIETSITTNGGFYIARYEAGLPEGVSSSSVKTDGTVRPVSKQRASVWNNIAWSDNGTNTGDGAVTVARSMYPEESENYGVVSTLIYGTQWDTALKFIGAYGGDTTYATDSTGKGNYKGTSGGDTTTDAPATCGLLDAFSQKNIYDMAGNVWELTMEKYITNRVNRGGDYRVNSDSGFPASYRDFTNVDFVSTHKRFSRSALYKAVLSPKEKRSN